MPNTDYEYSAPLTKGGKTGTYSILAPFPLPCEVAVISVVITDTGYVFVSPDASPPTVSQTAPDFSANPAGPDVLRGAIFAGGTNSLDATPDALFWQVSSDRTVYINISVANSHVGHVTLMFRKPKFTPQAIEPFTVAPEMEHERNRYHEAAVRKEIEDRERRGTGGRG